MRVLPDVPHQFMRGLEHVLAQRAFRSNFNHCMIPPAAICVALATRLQRSGYVICCNLLRRER